jgi:hypothetical protein
MELAKESLEVDRCDRGDARDAQFLEALAQ